MTERSPDKSGSGRPRRPKHDAAYKSFFGEKRTVADTLRALVRDAARHLDLATLERLPSSFVTEHLDQRHADMLWRVRAAGNGWVYLLVLLEFQSTVDRRMALRMADYWVRIMNALGSDALGPLGEYPLTIPVVVYNGDRPWTAATDVRELLGPVPDPLVGVVPSHPYLLVDLQRLDPAGMSTDSVVAALARFEQASSEGDLGEAVRALGQWAGQSAEPELAARLEAWINFDVRPRLGLTGPPMRFGTGVPKGENMTTMLDRIDQWIEGQVAQGREQGIVQGREQGIALGRGEGQRRLVHRLAGRRFGVGAEARLRTILDGISDPARIEAIADAVIECDSAEALIARAKVVAGT